MPLNDLVKDYSLTTISQKTNIPIGVLEKLLNKEWDRLQSTKAKGFIKIIEREFNLDLSELKDEANEYYKTHQKEEPHRPIDLVDAQSISNSSKIVTNIVALIASVLVVYAIWFYFFKSKDSNSEVIQESNSSGLIKESIDRAKSLVGITKKQPKEEPKKQEIASEQNSTKKQNSNKEQEVSKEEPKKKFDITTDVKKSEENSTIVQEESNKSKEENTNSSVIKTQNNSSSNLLEENTTTINAEVESLLEENKTVKSEENTTIKEDNSSIANQNINETNTTSELNGTSINLVTIRPTVKAIWVGIYDLKTHQRTPKLFSKEFKFETNGDDIAIVTGHSKFEIATDSGIVKRFNGKGRKYLYIFKDGIKELTKGEYRALTKRRAW